LNRTADGFKSTCITVLGSGFAPFAPGTWGSLYALLLFASLWWVATATALPRGAVELVLVAGIVLSSILAVAWGRWAVAYFNSGDPKPFTLDEFAGQWVALLILPIHPSANLWTLAWVAGGQFILFRIFDIIKPTPARQAERLPAGWGILTDDLVAGLYANIVGQVLWRLTPLPAWLGVTTGC